MLSISSARRIKGEEFKVVKDMELRIIDGCDGSICNYATYDITLSISVQLLIPYGYKHITIQGEIIMIIVISSSGIIIMIIVISSSGIIIMIIVISSSGIIIMIIVISSSGIIIMIIVISSSGIIIMIIVISSSGIIIIMIIVISSSGIIIMIIVISSSGIIIMIIIIMCMYVGMGSQGPQQVVVAVKFGVAFLLSFLPWLKVLPHSTSCREP